MTTPNVNAPVIMPAGAQEITSGKAKGDREDQSFMDVLSIADSAARTKAPEQKVQAKDVRNEAKAPKQTDKGRTTDNQRSEDVKPDSKDGGNRDVNETGKAGKAEKSEKTPDGGAAKKDEGIAEAVKDVKAEIEEKLGIPDEELTQVMETLGLTMADLLDPKTMVDIVAAVKDVTPVDMVADAELTGLVKDLQSTIREETADLLQKLDITPEELKQTLANTKTEYEVVSPGTEVQEKTADPFEDAVSKAAEDTQPVRDDSTIRDQRSLRDTVRTPAEAVPEEAPEDRTGRISKEREGDQEVSLNVTVKDAQGLQTTAEDSGQSDPSQDFTGSEGSRTQTRAHAETAQHTNNNIFFQNLTNAVENTLETMAAGETAAPSARMADAMDLINQINSQIRAIVDSETQSLSMQLHPQSLGRLNVELVSRSGQLTAQFEAESAAVKTALETRIAELKETLEQRGIRVENVEVTVASHEFEQNLMGGGQSGQTEDNPGARRGRRTRSINLSDTAAFEADGELPEEERITRDMMAANGNSVDYTA